ncbi:RNA-directed DNA polymerase from mobile element jockey [Eumeta japonica]|uniref:RNA-directed DNA polymerase from mobile element jockey n=1 Tax=Eumeta variegata TaxID=151549 RepID=A0A4C1VED5_EUMVA|nr:RNA-directed DNA polymerase from mobile element jockey [Eumeta japonica]
MALLVAIFKSCLKNCYFLRSWKEAVIIDIPKPRKPRDLPFSYKPISLLSGLAKLYKKNLKTRLRNHLLYNELIINEQFRFRPQHSCPQQDRAIGEPTRFFQLWRIEVNPEKAAAIYFDYGMKKRTRVVPINTTTLRMLNASIPCQHNYKYLGITLDKHLLFRDHIRRVRQLAKFYMSRLNGIIAERGRLREKIVAPPTFNKRCSAANNLSFSVDFHKRVFLKGRLTSPAEGEPEEKNEYYK